MNDEEIFNERFKPNIVVQQIQRYLPFWPLFVITTVVSLIVGYVNLRSEVPIFVASAKVLLKDPNKGSGDSKVLDALNIFGDKKIVENEIVVLKSTDMMANVVASLHLYASIFNQGRVRTEELYKDNAPVFFKTSSNIISPSPKYYFSVDWNKQQINIDNKIVHFNDSTILNNTVYYVEPNRNYPQNLKGKNYYVQFNSIEGTAAGIISSLRVAAVSSQSTVIELNLETPVPQKGVDIITKLFEVYNITGIKDKNQTAAKTLAFIDDRLGLVTSQLDSVEKNVESYKTKNQVIDLSAQGQLFLGSVGDLDKRKSEIEIQLDVLNDIDHNVNNKGLKAGTVPSLALLNDPTLATLLSKQYEAEIQLQKSRSIAGEKSDAVLLAEEQVNRVKQDVRGNINNIRKNLLSARSSINSNIGANTNILRQIPQKERGLIDVTRQQAIRNNIYSYLLQKREETAVNSASTIADLRVIERASFYGPIKPVARNYYLGGFVIGILLASFIILVREQFNRKVLFINEIEEKTKVPVVGEIVQVNTEDPIVILEGKRTVVAEQFRALRTNLSFMGINEELKTTLVSSNISGEGKSFVSINLAISHTLTNKRVALLELDLRKPRLSALLKVSRDPGISNYIVGKIPLEDIIKETSIKNLFLVSAGSIPPNPSELLLSNKFKEMMEEISRRFDYVIIDSAPVGPVSDSLLLSQFADITIFVIRHNKTPKFYLKQIDTLYQQKKFKRICIVFNGLKRRGMLGNYGYGNYAGYGYGSYGYGEGSQGYYYLESKEDSFLSRLKKFISRK